MTSIIGRILSILVSVAYYTGGERKLLGAVHRRYGPNVAGFWGVLQPIVDGVKLVVKTLLVPLASTLCIFIFAPVSIFTLSLSIWGVIPGVSGDLEIAKSVQEFINIWTADQWIKSIIGLILGYYWLFYLVAYFAIGMWEPQANFSRLLILGFILFDIGLNMIVGFGLYQFAPHDWYAYQLVKTCPIFFSPFIIFVNMIVYVLYLRQLPRKEKKKDDKKSSNETPSQNIDPLIVVFVVFSVVYVGGMTWVDKQNSIQRKNEIVEALLEYDRIKSGKGPSANCLIEASEWLDYLPFFGLFALILIVLIRYNRK